MRCTAKRVQWLMDLLQARGSHHTYYADKPRPKPYWVCEKCGEWTWAEEDTLFCPYCGISRHMGTATVTLHVAATDDLPAVSDSTAILDSVMLTGVWEPLPPAQTIPAIAASPPGAVSTDGTRAWAGDELDGNSRLGALIRLSRPHLPANQRRSRVQKPPKGKQGK